MSSLHYSKVAIWNLLHNRVILSHTVHKLPMESRMLTYPVVSGEGSFHTLLSSVHLKNTANVLHKSLRLSLLLYLNFNMFLSIKHLGNYCKCFVVSWRWLLCRGIRKVFYLVLCCAYRRTVAVVMADSTWPQVKVITSLW